MYPVAISVTAMPWSCGVQEELANVNMAKYRKLQQEMEGAVERADMAENTLGQLRARNRSASVAPESTTTFGLTVNIHGGAENAGPFVLDDDKNYVNNSFWPIYSNKESCTRIHTDSFALVCFIYCTNK